MQYQKPSTLTSTMTSKLSNKLISSLSLSTCALGLVVLSPAASAHAELSTAFESVSMNTQDGTTLKMVIAADTPLRCGDQDVFYTIAELSADLPLQTIGKSGAYTQVVLPRSIGAFVPASEADVSANKKTVTLTTSSSLRAPSHLLGLSGSWKAIYTTALPSGTTLNVIEVIQSDAGTVLGYRVVAPTSPSGELPVAFIKTDALRDPTTSEIDGDGSAPVTPISEPETEDPQNDPANEPMTDSTSDPVDSSDSVDTSEMEDMNLPDQNEQAEDQTTAPVEINNSAPIEVDIVPATEASQNGEPQSRTAPDGRVSAAALEDLEAAFDNARSMPKAELDEALSELHAEFTRTREQADGDESLVRALDQRLEWIKIRIESRDQRRAIAATLAAYDQRADQLANDIEAWQSGRAYQLVGRMVTSSVYTGEHLPLLYRVQSIDPTSGVSRTVGYVAPRDDQDFRHLLGRVVGVIGSMNADDSLKLSVIEPDRIDPMPE